VSLLGFSSDVSNDVISNALRYSTQNEIFIGSLRAFRQKGSLDDFEVGMKDLFFDGMKNGRDHRGSIYVWPSGNKHMEVRFFFGIFLFLFRLTFFFFSMTIVTIIHFQTLLIPYQVKIPLDFSLLLLSNLFFLSVGAVTHSGYASVYSTGGSCLLVVAPGGGDEKGLLTASENQGCTDTFGISGLSRSGRFSQLRNAQISSTSVTEGASAIAGGVVALILSANNKLTWRDVQHVLIHTARKIDQNDNSWIVNAGLNSLFIFPFHFLFVNFFFNFHFQMECITVIGTDLV